MHGFITQVIMLISAAVIGQAANESAVELFPAGQVPGEVPGFVGQEYVQNRSLPNGYVVELIHNVTVPTITPFLAPGCDADCTAVVIAPGGAYMLLAWDLEGTDVAKRFNDMGISAFVLKYRVPDRTKLDPTAPYGWAPLMDAQRAMGIVRSRAKEWNINPDRVGFMGFSAGGHLTAHITTQWDRAYPRVDAADDLSCRPSFSLLVYPWKLLAGNNASSTSLAPEVSNLTAATPPVMIAQNEDDPSAHVENSLMLYYHLKRAPNRQASSALHLYPTGGHGFGLCQGSSSFEQCCDWPLEAQRFLQAIGFAPNLPSSPCTGVFGPKGDLTCHQH